jgi:HSP20 family molecular chaperone IbpA
MTESETKELKVKEKQPLTTPAEQTRPGPVFSPNVDIFETDQAITVLADLPGIKADQLSIDLRDSILTLSTEMPEMPPTDGRDEEPILIEYEIGTYYRQFTLSNVIDQAKIDAQLKDGVLRLTLPKIEKATPRTITVSAE